MAKGPPFTRISGVGKGTEAVRASVNWFRNLVQTAMGGSVEEQVRKETEPGAQEKVVAKGIEEGLFRQISDVNIGSLFLYRYDPKWKKRLPYWDEFPLVFPFGFYKNGFIGINIHYLPNSVRAGIMSDLMALGGIPLDNQPPVDKLAKLRLSYHLLQQNAIMYKYWYKDCIKKYRYDHVRTAFNIVRPSNWQHAATLPIEKWVYRTGMRGKTPHPSQKHGPTPGTHTPPEKPRGEKKK